MIEATSEHRTALAHSFMARELARGNLRFGYEDIALHLTVHTGEWHTIGMVAGLLDRDGERDSEARRTWGH